MEWVKKAMELLVNEAKAERFAINDKITMEDERLHVDINKATSFMIGEDEVELNVFEVHSKLDGVAAMKKEKDHGGFSSESKEEKKEAGKQDKKQAKIEAQIKEDLFKVHNKPEGVAAKEKERAEHLDEDIFKIVEDEVSSEGGKVPSKILEEEAGILIIKIVIMWFVIVLFVHKHLDQSNIKTMEDGAADF